MPQIVQVKKILEKNANKITQDKDVEYYLYRVCNKPRKIEYLIS